MKLNLMVLAVAMTGAMTANAGEYVCKVYCTSGGATSATVSASSSSDAAKQLDSSQATVDRICKAAGKGSASTSSMGSSQCSSK